MPCRAQPPWPGPTGLNEFESRTDYNADCAGPSLRPQGPARLRPMRNDVFIDGGGPARLVLIKLGLAALAVTLTLMPQVSAAKAKGAMMATTTHRMRPSLSQST